jgi:GntR family transcriptional repressor for pyruvate dehydrogenase complex
MHKFILSDITSLSRTHLSYNKVLFTPVENMRAFEAVSSQIKTLVFEGVLQPGDRLPSEAELAKQFNVGRQTVREALRILELSGLIVVQKGFGGGPIIKDTILANVTDLLLDAFQMERISVDDFVVARLMVEKGIVNYAIDSADDQDVKVLQENLAEAKGLIANRELATDLNFAFHALLARASKNEALIILERAINAVHRKLRNRRTPDFRASKNAVKAHEKILDVFIKKDREKVINLLEQHILEVRRSY